jgi:hypothetical protein
VRFCAAPRLSPLQLFHSARSGVAGAVQAVAVRGERRVDTPHARDSIYRQAGGSSAELKLAHRTGGLKGHVGTIAIGVVV